MGGVRLQEGRPLETSSTRVKAHEGNNPHSKSERTMRNACYREEGYGSGGMLSANKMNKEEA